MAKFKVQSIEPRPDGLVACDTYVLVEVEVDDGQGGTTLVDKPVGHFTVILKAADVLACNGALPDRVECYKDLFDNDPRIAGILAAEEAVAKMLADITFPVTVNL